MMIIFSSFVWIHHQRHVRKVDAVVYLRRGNNASLMMVQPATDRCIVWPSSHHLRGVAGNTINLWKLKIEKKVMLAAP